MNHARQGTAACNCEVELENRNGMMTEPIWRAGRNIVGGEQLMYAYKQPDLDWN